MKYNLRNILRSFYGIIPFKLPVFSLIKKFWHPGEKLYRHLHFKGVFNVELCSDKSFKMKSYGYQVENEIFWAGINGGWEKESFKHWINLCQTSGVIIDIGANTGIYALMAKAINKNSKVYAFEPVERVFTKLEENVQLNNFDIHNYEIAVSDNNGEAIIYDDMSEHVYSVTVNKNLLSPQTACKEIKIKTKRLDSFIEENNITRIDLMKIDVETHEPEVLAGMGKYLKEFRPDMLIEILNEEIAGKVEKLVKDLDYLYFNIDEKNGLTTKTEKIEKSSYFNYLLCKKETASRLNLV